MNNRESKRGSDLEDFVDLFIDELLATSDEEILEMTILADLDVAGEARRIRLMLKNTATAFGKGKLADAKARLIEFEAKKPTRDRLGSMGFSEKQALLARISATHPELTLAARQGSTMSEADLDGLLADLEALGLLDGR